MALYKLLPSGVLRNDGVSIPPDVNNQDWRNYLEWAALGNTADPADPPTPLTAAEQRRIAAKEIAKAIPSWATWTQADWQTYFDNNLSDAEAELVTSLATARVMIKRQNLVIQNLVKMVIAMRDQVWPDLPE